MGLIDKVFGKNKKKDKDTSKRSLTHIFISYSSTDSDVAEEIYDLLVSIMSNAGLFQETSNQLEINLKK